MLNKKKLMSEKAGMSYFEIFIMIISIFAFSYIIYETSKEIEIVKAEEEVSWNCCQETKEGAICQDFASNFCQDLCSSECLPTKCEEVSECELGCCFNEQEGICMSNSPKQRCENSGGKWQDNAACNILQCKLGCCILGSETRFVTEKRCERLSSFYGFQFDFKPEIRTEIECLSLSHQQTKGACIIEAGEEKTCKFVSQGECLQLTGSLLNFYENSLCSNSELNTGCEKTEDKICTENRDKVYFVDSCGNIDEVYKNCNYPQEKCIEGQCKNLNCKDAPYMVDSQGKVLKTKDRINGESWCVYDSYIGEGKDVVGSRHFKYYCYEGEVKVEPCQDYRQEVCVESELGEKDKVSVATCKVNRWRECLDYNNLAEQEGEKVNYEKMIEKCEENSDCYINHVNVDEGFDFKICVPNYPSGFELEEYVRKELNKNICGMANQKCTVIYEKKLTGGWECVFNCDCETSEFTEKMNDLCISLGDCGGYVNIVGGKDEAYSVKGAPKIKLEKYEKYTQPVEGKKAEPGNMSEIFGIVFSEGDLYEGEEADLGEEIELILKFKGGEIIGAYGLALIIPGVTPEKIMPFLPPFVEASSFLTGFTAQTLGAIAGVITGYFIAKIGGAKGDAAKLVMSAGALGGAYGALGVITPLPTHGVVMIVGQLQALDAILLALEFAIVFAVILAVVALIITKILGIGDTKEVIVKFNCYPWEAPVGGQDCDKCDNVGELKQCSEYRCSSLGQACELINIGTGEERCIWNNPNDNFPPEISPWNEILTEGNKYVEVKNNGFKLRQENGECIEAFSYLTFGIETNENSQCKIDIENGNKVYEEMTDYFGGDNLYKDKHKMPFMIPHPEAFAYEYNLTYEYVLDKIGDMRFYVRCQDANGNKNIAPYLIDICIKPGPDLTAPIIRGSKPSTGSYIEFGLEEQDVTFYINEPGECKYSLQDKDYEQMENSMECETGLQPSSLYGWTCKDTLPLIQNEFYVRCKDQPWLSDDSEAERNVNSESYIYELKKSESELKIEKIEPEKGKEIKSGVEPASITLRAETSGGAENGEATCYFKFNEEGTWIEFKDTFSNEHSQRFDFMMRGTHTIYVKCEDIAGNKAYGDTKFKLKIDTTPPRVIRVYNEGVLKIITDEDSECVFSEKNCNFMWSNATKMTGILREHTTEWIDGLTYHIKCKDLWDNKPSGCSIIVKAV